MSRIVGTFAALILLASVSSCGPQLCNTDTECDDGYWCNGEEVCDVRPITLRTWLPELLVRLFGLTRGQCARGESPCCPADLDCMVYEHVASELCNEAEMLCETGDECQSNEECDDGIWCNGEELCASGFCFDASSPCSFRETCDEEGMQCEETNRGACSRVRDFCPHLDQTTEQAIVALLLGMADVPGNIALWGNLLCDVPEINECDWSSYADCVIANVTCEELEAGRPEVALSPCLGILDGSDCFVTVDSSE